LNILKIERRNEVKNKLTVLVLCSLFLVMSYGNALAVHRYAISPTTFNWIQVDCGDADDCDDADDNSFTYTLPWTFPYGDPERARDIVSIVVSSNGTITLQEAGEADYYTDDYKSADCSSSPPDPGMDDVPGLDIIFANHDDLSSYYYGYYAVKAYNAGDTDSDGNIVPEDVVVVLWETETYEDEDDDDLLNRFEVLLYPDGRIVWNFDYFEWTDYDGDPYSGLVASVYDHPFNPRWNSVGCASSLGFDAGDVSDAGGHLDVQEAYQAIPTPFIDIKANGSDGPVNLQHGDPLSVTIALQPDPWLIGLNSDWWVVAVSPFNRYYYYDFQTNTWTTQCTSCPPLASYQGPLANIGPYEVLSAIAGPQMPVANTPTPPVGTYTFYFGVDLYMNGIIDMDQMYYDSVVVNIGP
jgi:hypothetical protein